MFMSILKIILALVMFIALFYIVIIVGDTFLQILLLIGGTLFIALVFELTEDVQEAMHEED